MLKNKILWLATALAMTLTASAQRIAVLSDVHVVPGNSAEQSLRRAVAEIDSSDCQLAVLCGDLTNEGSDAQLANVKQILAGIKSMPLYVLPGNHEDTWSQSATHSFVKLFSADRFVGTTADSLAFVGINCGPYMKMGDGHIKQEDLIWLDATLDSLTNAGYSRILSFNHYPVRADDLDNWVAYAQVLMKYPVIAHVNGHYHRWLNYQIGNEIPAMMVRALEMRDEQPGYTILDISADSTHVYDKLIGHEPQLRDAFSNRQSASSAFQAPEPPKLVVPDGYDVKCLLTDDASIFTRLAIGDKTVYLGNSQGYVRAIDKADGRPIWNAKVSDAPIFSRPVILPGNKLAMPTADNGIVVLNTADGSIIKQLEDSEGVYVADGLLTPEKTAYLQGGYKRMERRDPNDCSLVWLYDSIANYCQAAPAVDGNDVIFGAWDTNLRCLDLTDGHLHWAWNNGKAANMLGPGNVVPVVTDKYVFIVAPDRYMTALDRATGQQIWRDKSHKYRESLGKSNDGKMVFAKTMDGELVAVDATKPQYTELWTIDMGLGYEHAPCIIAQGTDGLVYAGSRRGIVTAVDPDLQKVAFILPLGTSEVNGIDIDPFTGDILVSLIEGKVWRISPTKSPKS